MNGDKRGPRKAGRGHSRLVIDTFLSRDLKHDNVDVCVCACALVRADCTSFMTHM